MSYQLRVSESLVDGLRRLARKQLRNAVGGLARPSPRDQEIHDARKSLKKTRIILNLIERDGGRGLAKDQRRLRKISRTLAEFRDADAMVEVFDSLRQRAPLALSEPTFERVRQQLIASKQKLLAVAAREHTWSALSKMLCEARRSAKHWDPRHRKFPALAPGLERLLRRGRKAMARAAQTGRSEDFHQWRKEAKGLFYALRMLGGLGKTVGADIRELRRLESWLGDHHNLAVFGKLPLGEPSLTPGSDGRRRLDLAGDEYQRELRTKALEVGGRLYQRRPRQYVAMLGQRWKAWRDRAGTSAGAQSPAARPLRRRRSPRKSARPTPRGG